jgi:hypothetical protein
MRVRAAEYTSEAMDGKFWVASPRYLPSSSSGAPYPLVMKNPPRDVVETADAAEVDQGEVSGRRHDVRRFEIAVDESEAMQVVERGQQPDEVTDRVGGVAAALFSPSLDLPATSLGHSP